MPPVNAPWNKYEVALLVEAYNEVTSGSISRNEAVSSMSRRLRLGAQRIGLIISETYRNENGISLQMQAIKYCFTNKGGFKCSTHLFEQIAKLYKENSDEFLRLLTTAKKLYPLDKPDHSTPVRTYTDEEREAKHDDFVAEHTSDYIPQSVFIDSLKTDIFHYILKEYTGGCKSLRILKILNEFSEKLRKLDISTSNQLGLWIEKNFPNIWVANQFLLLNKSKFQTEDLPSSNSSAGKTSVIPAKHHLDIPDPICAPKVKPIAKDNRLKSVLVKHFRKGFRQGSVIERKKLTRFYKEMYQSECPIPLEKLDEKVCKLGIAHNSIVYIPDLMLTESVREDLRQFIEEKFAAGLTYINYASLYQRFRERLLDSQITTDEHLKLYLEYYYPQWHYKKDFLCKNSKVKPDIEREIFDYARECGCPVTEDEVKKALFYLPKDKLHQVFALNTDVLISTSRNGERYHIELLDITKNELESISAILFKTIANEEYMTWDDLSAFIHNNHSDIFERNSLISEIGIRNGLRVKLSKRFIFNSNLISLAYKEISVERIVERFIKGKSHFTLQEIISLVSEFGTGICWEEILKYSIRIDESNFVKSTAVDFDIDSIDQILENICGDLDYMPIIAIESFSQFPSCRYQWNYFLLENFVALYSKKFRIVHKDFNRNCVKGAIVRKDSKIRCISDIVLDQLIRAPKLYNEKEILELLKNDGYIARSRFGDINHIIERAANMRQL